MVRRWFSFVALFAIIVMSIFLYLTENMTTVLDNKNLETITDIEQIPFENNKPSTTTTIQPKHINPTITNSDNIEKNDVEFHFMDIKDLDKNISITPSPIVELPDHWINPCYESISKQYKFCNESLSFTQRSNDFTNQLNITELFWLTNAWAHDIKRNGFPFIPFHDWWNEALHGLSVSSGVHYWPYIPYATQFPQVIGLASSFNKQLWYKIAQVISTEARVYNNYNQSYLTFWSPNINILRDPRWGRAQETPSEDPFINGIYAMQFVHGMQGNHNKYLKTSACCKHFIGYSYESERTNFNSIIDEYDLNDTYLVPFKYCIHPKYGNASCVMCAYNQMNSIPSCLNKYYLMILLEINGILMD
eukprot:431014_1